MCIRDRAQRVPGRHDAQLLAVIADHAYLSVTNLLVQLKFSLAANCKTPPNKLVSMWFSPSADRLGAARFSAAAQRGRKTKKAEARRLHSHIRTDRPTA